MDFSVPYVLMGMNELWTAKSIALDGDSGVARKSGRRKLTKGGGNLHNSCSMSRHFKSSTPARAGYKQILRFHSMSNRMVAPRMRT